MAVVIRMSEEKNAPMNTLFTWNGVFQQKLANDASINARNSLTEFHRHSTSAASGAVKTAVGLPMNAGKNDWSMSTQMANNAPKIAMFESKAGARLRSRSLFRTGDDFARE